MASHFFDRHVKRLENARGQAFFLTQQPEQKVLGANVVVLEKTRLFLREDDYLPRSLIEALEHERTLDDCAGA